MLFNKGNGNKSFSLHLDTNEKCILSCIVRNKVVKTNKNCY